MDGLTEGRIVRFVNMKGARNAALVAKVLDRDAGVVNLCVFDDNGSTHGEESVKFAEVGEHEKAEPRSWHWIPGA